MYQALHKASYLVLARTHMLVVYSVHDAEQHILHKTRLKTYDNIKHVRFYHNTKMRKRLP